MDNAAVKDERTPRRFRATIRLNEGRVRVSELPTDPRGEARPVAAHPRPDPARVQPLSPWMRRAQPARQPEAAEAVPVPTAPAGAVHVPTAQPAQPTGDVGAATPSAPSEPGLVEQITEAVVERLRGSLGLAPDEPPIAPLEPDELRFGQPHLAGGFMHEPEPESVTAPSPAGAFASEPEPVVQHPAGSFTAE